MLDLLRLDKAVEFDVKKTVGLQWSSLDILGPHPKIIASSPGKKSDLHNWAGKTGRRMSLLKKFLANTNADASASAESLLLELWDIIKQYDRNVENADDVILITVGDGFRLNSRHYKIKLVPNDQMVLLCDTCNRICYLSIGKCCPRHKCPGSLGAVQRANLDVNHYRTSYEEEVVGSMRVEEHTAQLDSDKARDFQRDFKEGKINVLSCSTTFELGVDLGDLDTVLLRNVPPESFNYDQRVGRSGRRRGHAGFAVTFCKRSPHDLYHFADPLGMIKGKVKPPSLAIKNPKIILRHLTAYALSVYFRQPINRARFNSLEDLFVNLQAPSFADDFSAFLLVRKEYFQKIFLSLVPDDEALRCKLGLENNSWIELMTGSDSKLRNSEMEVKDDYSSVVRFEEVAKVASDYKLAEWARARATTIARDNVLNFLSRKTVIPKYGFPVDVVELDTKSITNSHSVGLDRDLAIAVSEFAPGSQLIANKKLWTSHGIKKVKDKALDKKHYFRCAEHNVFQEWSTATDSAPLTMGCSCSGQTGTYIVPAFGFTTAKAPPVEPKGRVAKLYSNRPYFLHNPNLGHAETSFPANDPALTVSQTMPGKMVVICEGKKGRAFKICEACGTGTIGKVSPSKKILGHKDSYDRSCNGMMETLSLGHQFETDIVQLTFKMNYAVADKLWFAYSLASAIVEAAATVLQVPASDISSTVGPFTSGALPAIIVYDNVPGGAGLVAKLEQQGVLLEVLEAAKRRVSGNCGCRSETSCYGCLRSYRNQFAHEKLTRGPVHEYLSEVLEKMLLANRQPIKV